MGGCLACRRSKPTVIITVDKPPTVLRGNKRTVRKPSTSEDFWTSSTHEMDKSTAPSQGSMSSMSTSNPILDPHYGSGNSNSPGVYVNHGLLLWNQTRQHWMGNKRFENRARQVKGPKLSWNTTYEGLLGSNKAFPQRIPLTEMVDFLVDVWEQEGMYDR